MEQRLEQTALLRRTAPLLTLILNTYYIWTYMVVLCIFQEMIIIPPVIYKVCADYFAYLKFPVN
jgi:hypothetical protein